MTAGRELDALVAEKVMGLKKEPHEVAGFVWVNSAGEKIYWPDTTPNFDNDDEIYLPEYSTDIPAAWEVVEKLKDSRYQDDVFSLIYDYRSRWHALILGHHGRADTAPLAICLAALKAVGENVENNPTPCKRNWWNKKRLG